MFASGTLPADVRTADREELTREAERRCGAAADRQRITADVVAPLGNRVAADGAFYCLVDVGSSTASLGSSAPSS